MIVYFSQSYARDFGISDSALLHFIHIFFGKIWYNTAIKQNKEVCLPSFHPSVRQRPRQTKGDNLCLEKIIPLTLIFAMLVPFTAAAAADEPSESRGMEEILDEYHRKAFEAHTQRNAETTSS